MDYSDEFGIRQKDTFSVVNERTGVIVSSGNEKVSTSNGALKKTEVEFTRMFVSELKLVVAMRLTGTQLRVLLCVICFTRFENEVDITQGHISELLGIDKADICKAIKTLLVMRLLYKRASEGKKESLYVSPYICWKGDEKLRKKEVRRLIDEDHGDAMDGILMAGPHTKFLRSQALLSQELLIDSEAV